MNKIKNIFMILMKVLAIPLVLIIVLLSGLICIPIILIKNTEKPWQENNKSYISTRYIEVIKWRTHGLMLIWSNDHTNKNVNDLFSIQILSRPPCGVAIMKG
jgi:hypothetical protein